MSQSAVANLRGMAPLTALRQALLEAPAGKFGEGWLRMASTAIKTPAALLVVVDSGREIRRGGYGLPPSLAEGTAALHLGVAPSLAAGSEVLAVADLESESRLSGGVLASAGVRALIAMPLSASFAELPAYVALLDFQVRRWTKQELQILRDLRSCLLQELETVWLRDELEHRQDEMRRERRAKVNLLAGIPFGLFLLDPDGRCLLLNPEAARFFQAVSQRAPEELIGRDLWQACPEVADSNFAREYRQALAEDRPFSLETYVAGLQRWYSFHGRRGPEGLYVLFRDVTEQTQRIRSLERAEQLAILDKGRGDFVAQLAHEVRNSLVPIANALHLVRVGQPGAVEVRQAQELAEREVHDVCRLLEDLLKVSQLAQEEAPPELVSVDVVSLVTSALRQLLSSPLYRAHSLDMRLPPEGLQVPGDPAMLERVLVHLLENAAKFTDAGGRISVEARRDGNSVLIRVSDNGVGIAADKLPNIFDLFMRPDRSERRLRGGVGIGLPLVRRLIALHGGEVTASSEGPGRGSSFIVRLRALSLADKTAAAAPAAAGGAKPTRVLVIDNSTETAQSMALLMQAWGYEVHVAYDPLTALELAQSQPPQVVLLDIGMPHMDGYEVARRLRQREESRHAVLVAVTGYGEEDDRRQAREAGFDFHMTKPVDPEELHQLLQQAGFHGTPHSTVA